jgi:hypothetical protein
VDRYLRLRRQPGRPPPGRPDHGQQQYTPYRQRRHHPARLSAPSRQARPFRKPSIPRSPYAGSMPNSLQSPPVRPVLDRLFKAAEGDAARSARMMGRHPDGFSAAREKADAYEELYIPVSPEGGRLLYALIRASRPSVVVEFGT